MDERSLAFARSYLLSSPASIIINLPSKKPCGLDAARALQLLTSNTKRSVFRHRLGGQVIIASASEGTLSQVRGLGLILVVDGKEVSIGERFTPSSRRIGRFSPARWRAKSMVAESALACLQGQKTRDVEHRAFLL